MEHSPMLIGIAGPKASGKDTVARYLGKAYGFHADSFAAPIRKFTCELLGMTPTQLDESKEEMTWLGTTPRRIMQTFGTEWGRSMVNPDIWIMACMRRIGPLRERGAHVVISDVRFENEARIIRQRGGRIIRLRDRGITGDDHVSEKGLPDDLVDFTVSNGTDLLQLYQRIDRVMAACGVMSFSDMRVPIGPPNAKVEAPSPATWWRAIKAVLSQKSALWYVSALVLVVCIVVIASCGIWIKNAEIFHPELYERRAWIGFPISFISAVTALLAADRVKNDDA